MKRKREVLSAELRSRPKTYICAHASWVSTDGHFILPEGVSLTLLGPLGSALSKPLAKAIVSGETIASGDISIRDINPIILFNLGYSAHQKGDYKKVALDDYPRVLKAGEKVANFQLYSPGEDALNSSCDDIEVLNLTKKMSLKNLLEESVSGEYVFGGCSWVCDAQFTSRKIIKLSCPVLEEKYTEVLSESQRLKRRKLRFGNKECEESSSQHSLLK